MSSKMKRPEKSPSAGYPCSAPHSRQGPDTTPPRLGRNPLVINDSRANDNLSHQRTRFENVHHTISENEDELMARLDGKVAVITGGSSGIGLASAQRFIEEGAHVFITGRRQSELDKAKALIGDGVTTVAVDSTKSADLDALFATVLEEKGGLDILLVNSGRVEPEELGKVTEENFDLTFDLNARGALFTVQKALPLMREGGSVILVGSIAGYAGVPGYTTYSATKAALRSYTRTWTREFNDRGIRFNTLSPGPVDTPIMDGQADSVEAANEIKAQFAAAIPLNRLGR